MITDFIKKNNVPEELIKEYTGMLPAEFISFWREYGFGTFYNGYLKSINPKDYKDILEQSYFQGGVAVPVFATAFGDLIVWEKNQFIGIVKYRYGENDIISDGADFFFDDLLDGEFDNIFFSIKKYLEASKKIGKLEYDECFGYVPLLLLGGKETVDHIKKVKIREHITLISEMAGGI